MSTITYLKIKRLENELQVLKNEYEKAKADKKTRAQLALLAERIINKNNNLYTLKMKYGV